MKQNIHRKYGLRTVVSLWLFLIQLSFSAAKPAIETFAGFPETPATEALPSIRGDISYASTPPITLSRSGTYRLAGPLTAADGVTALTLSANNITLDLDGNVISGGAIGINVTGNEAVVKNGVIQNAGAAGTVGIVISGSKGLFENLEVIHTNTGFLLRSTHENQLTNCRALSSTSAGFSLVSSNTNCFSHCQALNTNGESNSAYGFISQDGYGNNFAQCIAQDTRTATPNTACISAGFLLVGETASTLNKNTAIGTLSTASTTTAYGIYFDTTQDCVCTQNTASNNTTVNTLGIGIRADSAENYVAQNTAYNNDTNFQDISSSYLDSQANARGVDNIDAHLTTSDIVVTINTQVNPLVSENVPIKNNINQVNTLLGYINVCQTTPVLTSGTIASNKTAISSDVTLETPGCYCLSTNLGTSTTGASLAISGNNITLDLNGYTIDCNNTKNAGITISGNEVTVKNGTIQNAATNGVWLSGSRCILDDVDVVSSPTGFYLSNAYDNTLTDCRAISCTQNGFYLSGCQRNKLIQCHVIDVGGSTINNAVVSGFLINGGQSNIFNGCTIDNAFTNYNSTNAQAQGFCIAAEDYSIITNCTVNGVNTTGTLPNVYGIRAPLTQVQNLSYIDSIDATTDGNSVAWLEKDGNRYIALGCSTESNKEIQILTYTGAALSPTTSFRWPPGADAQVNSVAWLQTTAANFLAIGSNANAATEVQVFSFIEQPASLIQIAGANNEVGAQVNTVDWFISCTSGSNLYYLAAGSANSTAPASTIRVHAFNGSKLTRVAYYNGDTNTVNSLDWLSYPPKAYLAVGKVTSGGAAPTGSEIRVFEFTGNTLTSLANTIFETEKNVNSVKWLKTTNGDYYLASGETNTPQIRILKFDPIALTLTPKCLYQYGTATNIVSNVSWFTGIDDLNYLAIAGDANGQEVQVLRFDGSCLTPIYTLNPSATSALAVDWLITGSTILAVGVNGTTITACTLGFSPTRNQITNNTIINVRGGTSAIAYAVDTNNVLNKNTAYNNDTNYYYTPGYGDSNQGY